MRRRQGKPERGGVPGVAGTEAGSPRFLLSLWQASGCLERGCSLIKGCSAMSMEEVAPIDGFDSEQADEHSSLLQSLLITHSMCALHTARETVCQHVS